MSRPVEGIVGGRLIDSRMRNLHASISEHPRPKRLEACYRFMTRYKKTYDIGGYNCLAQDLNLS
jgi:hypothetical protein